VDSEKDDSVEGSDISDESIKTDHTTTPIDKDFTKKELKESKNFKPTRLIGFPTDEIEIQFKDKNKKVVGYWKSKKYRKEDGHFIKIMPKHPKNPDKKVYANVGKYPYNTSIYTYSNNDSYVYIAKGVDYIQMSTEDFFILLIQALGHVDIDQDFRDKVIMASLSLQLRHYKQPFVKVGLEKIKEFKLDDILKEWDEHEKQQQDKRKELGK